MEDWDELSISLLVSRLRHVSYVHTAALVYNICDYAQTFELEVDYMWPGKWTLVKFVYFMGRYAGLLDYPLMFIHNHVGALSTSTCSIIMHVASCSALIGASFGEVLLFLRVYVLSGCSRPVGWYLGIQYSLLFTAMFVLAVLTLKSVIYTPSPVPTHTGCYIHYASKVYITALYGLVLLQQTGVITLSFYFGLSNFRKTKSPLITILYRDGTLYFLILTLVTAINIATVITAPQEYYIMFLVVQRCFHSTLSTRTILKLRQMARRDLELSTFMRQFELCCDEEQQVCLSGLVGSSDSEVVQPVRGERGGGGEGEGPSSRAPLALGSSTTALVAVSEFGPAPSLDIDSEPPTTNAPRLPLAVAWANDHTVTTHCTPTSRPGSSGPSGPQFTKEQHDFIADGPDVRSIASRVSFSLNYRNNAAARSERNTNRLLQLHSPSSHSRSHSHSHSHSHSYRRGRSTSETAEESTSTSTSRRRRSRSGRLGRISLGERTSISIARRDPGDSEDSTAIDLPLTLRDVDGDPQEYMAYK